MIVFPSPVNNVASTLALNYIAGSGTVALVEGYGATINERLAMLGLPSISPTAPLRFSLYSASMMGPFGWFPPGYLPSIYNATGLSGDDLTGVTIQEGTTDQNFVAGDIFRVALTAGEIAAIEAAIQDLSSPPDGILKGVAGTIETAIEDIDYASITGAPGVTTVTPSGSIVTVQSDGLVIVTNVSSSGAIVTSYGAPVNKTRTTVVNSAGQIITV